MELASTLTRLRVARFRLLEASILLVTLVGFMSTPSSLAATAPAWVNQIAPGTWGEIGLNTMKSVDPEDDSSLNPNYPNGAPWHAVEGQSGVLQDWNGGALASGYGTHGALLVHGGGHNGYFGSEVYAFDLGTQLWKRLTDPYAGPFNWPFNTTAYPDGSPVPTHTYDYVDYHPGTNSFVVMRSIRDGVQPTANTEEARAHLLDLDTGKWRHSQRNNGLPLGVGGSSCFDRNRDVFWIMGTYETKLFAKFNPNVNNNDGTVGSYTNYTGDNVDIDTNADCDPVEDLYVYTEFRATDKVYARNLKDPAAPRVTLNETGDIPSAKEGGNAWNWSDKRQAFIYWRRGGGVYEFKHVAGAWDTGTWRWTNLTSSGNSVVPVDMDKDNGVYSRLRIARYDNAEVAVVVNRIDGPVYAFRLPDSSVDTSIPAITLSASPRNISSGQASTLSWAVTQAVSCMASGAWSGIRALSGSESSGLLTANRTYTLDCQSSAGVSSSSSVTVTVAAGPSPTPTNAPPLLSGTPSGTVLIGTTYSFLPNASDSDSNTLTFTIVNKPAWASFSSTTGELSGSPGSGDVGVTSGIGISVSDGTATVSLAPFNITVEVQGTLSGTLSWNAPTVEADGTPLGDLAGYKIYFGTASRAYTQTVRLTNPGLTSHTIGGLLPGTYYFAVTAFDSFDNESALSEEVVGVLRASPESTGGGTGGTSGGTTGSSSGGISAVGPGEVLILLVCALVLTLRRRALCSSMEGTVKTGFGNGVFPMSWTKRTALVSSGWIFFLWACNAVADDADFQARCSAPGVVKCVGFDSAAEIAPGVNLYPAWDGQIRGVADTAIKASGSSSLRFEVPAYSAANTSGYSMWDMGRNFGPGSTFYVQFRQRFSQAMLDTQFNSNGWKQVIFHRSSVSCGSVELTTQNSYNQGFPIMYTDCGARSLRDTLINDDYMLQQGDYQCRYSSRPAGCATYKANQWMTFSYRVQIGEWNTPTSSINAWVAYEGEPLKQWIKQDNFELRYGDSPTDTYSKIQLTTYQSKKDTTQNHPVGYVWYDELIVSTQPIAGPGGSLIPPPDSTATPPAPPLDIKFQP